MADKHDNGWRTNTETGGKFNLEWSYDRDLWRSDREIKSKKSAWINATKTNEVRALIKKEFGFEMPLGRMPVAHAKQVADGFKFVLDEVPEMSDLYKSAKLEYGRTSGDADAQVKLRANNRTGEIEQSLRLSPSVFNDENFSEELEWRSSIGYHPKGASPKTIIAHESAHLMHNYLASKSFKSRIIDKIGEGTVPYVGWRKAYCEELVFRAMNRLGDKYHPDSISTYAAQDPYETLAESWADWAGNKSKAQPLSKEIVKIMKEEMKKHG